MVTLSYTPRTPTLHQEIPMVASYFHIAYTLERKRKGETTTTSNSPFKTRIPNSH